MASSERIFGLLDTKPEIESPPEPASVESFVGNIEFRHVWFAYEGENYVLRDISFTVPAGNSIALVGATGAGKSSIINLLCRFYEVSKGQILIDGVDIREMDVHQLRRQIGVVLQDVFLFTGDIESNIRLGEGGISSEQVEAAARYVNADRFIRQLPEGYEAEVKERGSTFSVGQKQLLAFARALAFAPKILVLDEATSSIDTETELLIQDAVSKLMQGRTSVVIAHRLSTIQHADNIVVLHKGEIREMGNHQALLAQGGIYYRLFQLQYKDQEVTV
jgi:ABC-type multidrug transport system fused ATPase/permease subunit